MPFGRAARAAAWQRFRTEGFDCLVVGGGITGSGVAWDAALRGLRVALVEKEDFASGTSSGSSQLIHGGLRYLEQFDIDLVFEALRERGILLQLAAPFVRPLRFLFPIYEGGRVSPAKLAAGIWLYDLLSFGRGLERHRKVPPGRVRRLEPGLRRQGLRAVRGYTDACTDDARLVLVTARSAARAGAACSNYAEVVEFVLDGTEGARVVGARVRDLLSGAEATVRARCVVNATGVWSERVLALTGRPVRSLLRPTKGSHLVFSHGRLPVRHALIFESPVDGRILFIVPWEGFTLVGTTEVDYDGEPEAVQADASEIRYLLQAANTLFPSAGLRPQDAQGTYAALRPLLESDSSLAGALSREHAILEGPPGMVTIAGGKLTTFRAMAEEAVDLVCERLRDPAGKKPPTSTTVRAYLSGAVRPQATRSILRELEARALALGILSGIAERLFRRYGRYAACVLDLAGQRRDWAAPLAPRVPYLAAEVAFAARYEMAASLSDFMLRRTRLVYATGDRDVPIARCAAEILREELGWDAAEMERQLERYREDRAARHTGLSR